MLIFILDVSHGHFTSIRRMRGGLKETTRIFYYLFLSLSDFKSVLWHKSIIYFYFVYSHVTTIANITCGVTCKNAVSNATTTAGFSEGGEREVCGKSLR